MKWIVAGALAASLVPSLASADGIPDPGTLKMPVLSFDDAGAVGTDYDKYYYFHRPDTGFAEAYADIHECDALASGISFYSRGLDPGYVAQYGIGGVIGSAIGEAVADAIYGSAHRRAIRRINMRNCMSFKGYSRYGLRKDLWQEFNFEEGLGREEETVRELDLARQALVASGPQPTTRELGA
jgi:hypothetical protein